MDETRGSEDSKISEIGLLPVVNFESCLPVEAGLRGDGLEVGVPDGGVRPPGRWEAGVNKERGRMLVNVAATRALGEAVLFLVSGLRGLESDVAGPTVALEIGNAAPGVRRSVAKD